MAKPSFYDAGKVHEVWVERAALVAEEAARAKAGGIAPATGDRTRIAAFGIDCQVGFCTPGASLFVPGAVDDTRRTVDWLYANLERITQLVFSLDTHRLFQIFHPAFWLDASGAHPAPFTPVTAKEVRDGRFRPVDASKQAACLEYVERLENSGKYTLVVWPYHTLLGGTSHALVPALMEAAMFHALARGAETVFETKGMNAMTEMYSVLSPEVREVGGESVGGFNEALFGRLVSFDRVYVFGQAKSHCVLSTLRDLREHIEKTDPKSMGKIWILEDATSSVPGFDVDAAYAELRDAGMHVVKTTDPV
jgi:nicotinamidase-related amidase